MDRVVHVIDLPPSSASTDGFDATANGLDAPLEALRQRLGIGLTFVPSVGEISRLKQLMMRQSRDSATGIAHARRPTAEEVATAQDRLSA
jgi:hypothetical protein